MSGKNAVMPEPATEASASTIATLKTVFAQAAQGSLSISYLFHVTDILVTGRRPDLAIALFRSWLAHTVSPAAHVVWYNLGVALAREGDLGAAVETFRQALAVNPQFDAAHFALGAHLERVGALDLAIAQWRHGLRVLDPATPDGKTYSIAILNNLGRVLERSDPTLREAEELFQRSLELDPDQPDVIHHLVNTRQLQCRWPVYPGIAGVAPEFMLKSTSSMCLLNVTDDPALQLEIAQGFVARRIKTGLPPLADRKDYGHDRLRIGYLSSDFCNHPVAMLIVELLELHDRSRVEVYGYCWSRNDGSPLRQRLIQALDHYVPIGALDDLAAARRIRADEIDVLIDLHGLTSGLRADILSHRPAPLQVTYLGFPGTTALPEIDGVLVDDYLVPPDLRPYFTEQPLPLPTVFQVSDRQRTANPPPSRHECGLPDDRVVFCSFNNNHKFTPPVFGVWMNILRRVPGSVLWLLADNQWGRASLTSFAVEHGIEASRLIFAPRVMPKDYLARYQVADLFLDTFPFNAGATANDVLWMGLPLLTCSGRAFASRMAGSLLLAAGLPELITTSLQEYEDVAVRLASEPGRLSALRHRLETGRATSPLFDVPRIVTAIEDTLLARAGHPTPRTGP
jgi:predicted O-linked N-acetylglucosamine transferase (SPINDLY family)